MPDPIRAYLRAIRQELQAGNATEHTHRPALKTLIEELAPGVTATNEPRRIACGAPDYALTRDGLSIGYIEAKDVGLSLDDVERSEQLVRYRRALSNLVLTDYLVFRWYVDGDLREKARLARTQSDGNLASERGGSAQVQELLERFVAHDAGEIGNPRELAERMARLTHIIRDIIVEAFETDQASPLLQGWREAFARVLISDLDQPEKTADFADMFAQTLAYGLFTARVMDDAPGTFTRGEAQYLIPRSNPFLRDFFIQISGPQLDEEPYGCFVDDLVRLLAHTDMAAVLADFGRRTRQEDPVVHFYETFLAAYDPKLRESRGVYYTPEPVVSYIVRSVDHLLKTRFDCPDGLADATQITIPNTDPALTVKGSKQMRKTTECHKVLVLDPATGTGTFLYSVVDLIRQQFIDRGDAGMWPGYVKEHLLPRLFGFELLMAPYAVAHFKLAMQLAGHDLPDGMAEQWGYTPGDGERLGVYLTNTLEEAHEWTGLPLFTQWVADETNAANRVKQHLPVLVVMGNPPYSGISANTSQWIEALLRGQSADASARSSYYEVDGSPLGERKLWLQDDYVKFIRFAQWRIDVNGEGVFAFITNHSYLDNPTFRGMRQSLLRSFDQIYILNLHGSSIKHARVSGDSPDENVFDIRQGVAIGIFVKDAREPGDTRVHYSELVGTRQVKYELLSALSIDQCEWEELRPTSPYYFFVPRDERHRNEYESCPKITDILPVHVSGIVTARDRFAYDLDESALLDRVHAFADASRSDVEIRARYFSGRGSPKYPAGDTRGWKVPEARLAVRNDSDWDKRVEPCSYRPFDARPLYYTEWIVDWPRSQVMANLLVPNIAFHLCRQIVSETWRHVLVTDKITDDCYVSNRSRERGYALPLFSVPTAQSGAQASFPAGDSWLPDEAHGGRVPNLDPGFVAEVEAKLGLAFTPHGPGDLGTTFGPEDVFHYIYAVLHSPTYRARYAEFLKIDFPRIPLTSDVGLFRALCSLGAELVALHLLESPQVSQFITRYPVVGDNTVAKGYPKYAPPKADEPGRVAISKEQHFDGVPQEVWGFYVGGYQPAQKWLKDRRGRKLTYDDLTHYQKMVVAMQRTLRVMEEIDEAIPAWPIE